MLTKNNQISEKTLLKWVKEGRGSGHGSEYRPWLTVRDLPSLGRVHRIFGHKSHRTHHLLSDLELAVFLLLEWLPEVRVLLAKRYFDFDFFTPIRKLKASEIRASDSMPATP